jgi:hypothetical protein
MKELFKSEPLNQSQRLLYTLTQLQKLPRRDQALEDYYAASFTRNLQLCAQQDQPCLTIEASQIYGQQRATDLLYPVQAAATFGPLLGLVILPETQTWALQIDASLADEAYIHSVPIGEIKTFNLLTSTLAS